MKTVSARNFALSVLAVAGVAAYVLACTSFSPDDSKLLIPAFDPKTGDVGVSIYDRETRQVSPVFVPSRLRAPDGKEREAILLRPQWMPDGKRILVVWPGYSDNDDDVLNVAVVPLGLPGTVRLLAIPGMKEAQARLLLPFAVAKNCLFVSANSNLIVRLNLDTGETATHALKGKEISLFPSPQDEGIYYFAEAGTQPDRADLGKLDPDTFAQTPIWQVDSKETQEGGAFAISPSDGRLAMVRKLDGKPVLKIWKGKDLEKTLPLGFKEERVYFGSGAFSAQRDLFYAAYASEKQGSRETENGLVEIPLGGGPVRRVPLIRGNEGDPKEDALKFQLSLSHDGKTAALCSTYLAVETDDKFKPADCALFLVDLSDPERRVTKTLLPMPGKSNPEKAEEKR
jgi:hypothetical protein